MTECLDCNHTYVVKDSRGNYHTICLCVESDDFLRPVDIVFGSCNCGESEEAE